MSPKTRPDHPGLVRALLVAGALLVAATAPASAVAPVARPDIVYVVAGTPTRLPHHRLLANDSWSGTPTLELASAPLAGNVTAGNGYFVYDPGDREQGHDDFDVRLVDPTGSAISTVRVILVPRMLPIAGRWPVEKGLPKTPCADGDGAEIGFYLPRSEHFVLCDFNGIELLYCVDWEIARTDLVQDDTLGTSPRLPLVGDWDLDGWDEPALFDPATGEATVYEVGGSCGGRPCLVPSLDVVVPVAPNELPLRATWGTDAEPTIAGYDWFQEAIVSGPGTGMQLALGDAGAAPLAGDWAGEGQARLARWQPTANTVHFLAAGTGQASVSFQPDLQAPGLDTNIAFSGRFDQCSGQAFFGVLQLEQQVLGLYTLSRDGHARPPVHVKVPVDPPDVGSTGDDQEPFAPNVSAAEGGGVEVVSAESLR